MKKIFSYLLILCLTFLICFSSKSVFSLSLDEEIAQIAKEIADLEKAIAPLKSESGELKQKISSAKSQIISTEKSIADIGQKLIDKEADLKVQELLLNQRIKRYYINSKKFNPFLIFISSKESSDLLRQYSWYQSVISQDKNLITQYSSDISNLNNNKKLLETEKVRLAKIKTDLESRFGFLSTEIQKAEDHKKELSKELLNLEAQRINSLNLPTSVGSGIACVDDRTINPGFSPGFAFFTFGIPHHVGLNQYGAYGRANEGQSYDQILRAYYNFDEYQNRGSITIKVNNGNGINQGNIIWTGTLEDYIKRIYEVPASWPIESLKAQVIAARSYVLAVTNNGSNSICDNQYCQVFKTNPKGGQWEQAVNETSGKVMIAGGQPITAWFASTAGGYTVTNNDIWGGEQKSWTKRLRDTNGDINSFEDLFNKAYDRDSPCFYSAQGYRKEYNNSAWLKPEEVADIVNAILLGQRNSSIQGHLCQIDKDCCVHTNSSCKYTPWSIEKLKEELRNNNITPFNSINNISVSWDKENGKTTRIHLSGDAGSVDFEGSVFKSYFNSRAPANIAIVGPLYNIEKR